MKITTLDKLNKSVILLASGQAPNGVGLEDVEARLRSQIRIALEASGDYTVSKTGVVKVGKAKAQEDGAGYTRSLRASARLENEYHTSDLFDLIGVYHFSQEANKLSKAFPSVGIQAPSEFIPALKAVVEGMKPAVNPDETKPASNGAPAPAPAPAPASK